MKIHKESWSALGDHIEVFLTKKKIELNDDNFDLLIGFSRGGVILSNILACLMKDKFENYKEEKKLCLRSIPTGVYLKTKIPCFLITNTATQEELHDINNHLEKDLKQFHDEQPEPRKLNILVIDDNLTGSTRIFEARDFLKSIPYVGTVKTLAYTRAKDFKRPRLDYQIYDSPDNTKFFIMPWHEIHNNYSHPILKDEETIQTTLNILLTGQKKIHLTYLVNEIMKTFPNCRIDWHDDDDQLQFDIKDCFNIRRGTTDIVLYNDEKANALNVSYILEKFYPPKVCLEGKKAFESESNFCNNGIFSSDLCFHCTLLNCHKELLKLIIEKGNFSKLTIENIGDKTNENVLNNVQSWFIKNKNYLNIEL